MPNAAQIIQPQKPDSTSGGPDARKAFISGKVLEQEFIERQQQADLQRYRAFIGFGVPTRLIATPSPDAGSATCGVLSILVY